LEYNLDGAVEKNSLNASESKFIFVVFKEFNAFLDGSFWDLAEYANVSDKFYMAACLF